MESEILTSKGVKLYLHPADNKKYSQTVVFVHHMWGNYKTTWRHYRQLNELGFDCVTFDLCLGSDKHSLNSPYFLKYIYRGIFYLWYKQIAHVLSEIEGKKIVYAFSGPSLSSFWACHKRSDIDRFVCDGGPFHDIYRNSKNFFSQELGIENPLLNSISAFLGTSAWGYKPLTKLHSVLDQWNPQVSILSIRGVEDNIVDIESIRKVFTPHSSLNLQTLELEHGKHLNGLRDFSDDYLKVLIKFLTH